MLERSRPGPPCLHPAWLFYLLFPLASLSLFVLLVCPLPASLLYIFVLFLFSSPLELVGFWFRLPLKAAELFGDGSPTALALQPSPRGARSAAVGDGVHGAWARVLGLRGSWLYLACWLSSTGLLLPPAFQCFFLDSLFSSETSWFFPVGCGGCIPLCPFLLSCWRWCEAWSNHGAPTALALLLLALNLPFIANVPGRAAGFFFENQWDFDMENLECERLD